MKEEIMCLNIKKPITHNDIPAKLIVLTKDTRAPLLTKLYNNSKYDGSFPISPKSADITPAHKKDERTKRENYRPVSVLPSISKILREIRMLKYIVT